MSNDLRERYIYAATKNLPRGVRADIRRELETLIDDMLEARCGGEAPTEKDLRVVLTELGTPAELFRKYSPDAGKALIGQDYYPQYKRLLTFILGAVLVGMLIAHLAMGLVNQMSWGDVALNFLDTTTSSMLSAFAGVTIVFAILERRKVHVGTPSDTIENLPPVPGPRETIPRAESAVGLALCIFFTLMLLFFPQLMGAQIEVNGVLHNYEIFVPQVLRGAWLWIVLFGAAGAVRTTLRLIVGRRTSRLLVASLVCDAVSIPLACLIFLRDGLMNPSFQPEFRALVGEEPAFLYAMFEHFNLFFLGLILFAIALDMLTDVVRTLRARQ